MEFQFFLLKLHYINLKKGLFFNSITFTRTSVLQRSHCPNGIELLVFKKEKNFRRTKMKTHKSYMTKDQILSKILLHTDSINIENL